LVDSKQQVAVLHRSIVLVIYGSVVMVAEAHSTRLTNHIHRTSVQVCPLTPFDFQRRSMAGLES
jgi:hypothetical protein